MKKPISIFLLLLSIISCNRESDEEPDGPSLIAFKSPQKTLADKIISCFENDTPVIQYSYIEYLDDGRGYTAGKAGFTTATGDLLAVVEKYTELSPNNLLAQFLPILKNRANAESDDVTGLEDLPNAWVTASSDSNFIKAQDFISDSFYYDPSVGYGDELGAKLPVTLLCIYDACIQHGDGEDPDGLYSIIEQTNSFFGGSPADGTDEIDWLLKFNEIRRSILLDPTDPDTQVDWAESVGRVDALDKIIEVDNNYNLTQPTVSVNPFGTLHIINL